MGVQHVVSQAKLGTKLSFANTRLLNFVIKKWFGVEKKQNTPRAFSFSTLQNLSNMVKCMNAVVQVLALIYYSPIISVNNKQSFFVLSQLGP